MGEDVPGGFAFYSPGFLACLWLPHPTESTALFKMQSERNRLENDFSHAKDPDDGRKFVSSVERSVRISSHTPFDVFGQVKLRVYVLGCNKTTVGSADANILPQHPGGRVIAETLVVKIA
jgi:hypothetical protein